MTYPRRVLLLAPPEYDYLTDGVYHGLVELVGRDRVVDYPRQQRYHRAAVGATKYPMLHFPDGRVGNEGAAPALVRDDIGNFDLVVIGRLHASLLPTLSFVLANVERQRLVYLDGMDDPFLRVSIGRKVSVYFKRELLVPSTESALYRFSKWGTGMRENLCWTRDWLRQPRELPGVLNAICAPFPTPRRVEPLPFGLVDVGYTPPNVEKEYDLAFIGTLSSPRRQQVLTTIETWNRKRKRRLLMKVTDRISWREYLDMLSRTRICINVRGAGIDTYRYWEIPYSGSMLLSERPLIEIPFNFDEGRQAVFFSAPELEEKLDRLFDDPDQIERIAQAGRQHLMQYHTTVSRARSVLEAWDLARRENSGRTETLSAKH